MRRMLTAALVAGAVSLGWGLFLTALGADGGWARQCGSAVAALAFVVTLRRGD